MYPLGPGASLAHPPTVTLNYALLRTLRPTWKDSGSLPNYLVNGQANHLLLLSESPQPSRLRATCPWEWERVTTYWDGREGFRPSGAAGQDSLPNCTRLPAHEPCRRGQPT